MQANLIQPEQIEQAILLIRKELQLSDEEAAGLIFQSGRSKQRGGRRRSLPYAFTEEGVAVLSSVLCVELQPSAFSLQPLLPAPPATPRREIGYHVKEGSVPYRMKRN